VVAKVYKDKLWGYTVEIAHSESIRSVYKNLQKKTLVKEGEEVKKGQAIGTVGKSAAVESREKAHLHFEIWQDGIAINPISYVY
jgi:murein DD-endopeptidase MepM/ murein hydrolase activator NlpD